VFFVCTSLLRSGTDRIVESLKTWPELVRSMHGIDSCDAKLTRTRDAWLSVSFATTSLLLVLCYSGGKQYMIIVFATCSVPTERSKLL